MVELIIKIPESEIPKQQDIIEIPLHFIDGKICEAGGYEFDVLPKGRCENCDKWHRGITRDYKDWYSDEGYCTNWHTMTGEKFYCGDFEVKENK